MLNMMLNCHICDKSSEKFNECLPSCTWILCEDCNKEYSEDILNHRSRASLSHPGRMCRCVDYYALYNNRKLQEVFCKLYKSCHRRMTSIAELSTMHDTSKKINKYRVLKKWYNDCPDDIEQQDISSRNRLSEIRTSIVESNQYHFNTKSEDYVYLLVRPPLEDSITNIKSCNGCSIPLTRVDEANVVQCGLCKTTFNWVNMSITSDNPQEIIDRYSNHTSVDAQIAGVIAKIWSAIPNMRHMNYYDAILEILRRDNSLERDMLSYTRGYILSELEQTYADESVYCDTIFDPEIIMGILSRMNLNIGRYLELNRLWMLINEGKELSIRINVLNIFYNNIDKLRTGEYV